MSVQTRVIEALRSRGLYTLLPLQHEGRCMRPYYVVTDAGRRPISKNNALRVVYVTAYVPAATPMQLEDALIQAREALLRLRSVTVGASSEMDIDEECEAVYAAIEVTALCAM